MKKFLFSWLWIKSPWFTASVDIKEGIISTGAPITKWMWGKPVEDILKLQSKPGWDIRPF